MRPTESTRRLTCIGRSWWRGFTTPTPSPSLVARERRTTDFSFRCLFVHNWIDHGDYCFLFSLTELLSSRRADLQRVQESLLPRTICQFVYFVFNRKNCGSPVPCSVRTRRLFIVMSLWLEWRTKESGAAKHLPHRWIVKSKLPFTFRNWRMELGMGRGLISRNAPKRLQCPFSWSQKSRLSSRGFHVL